MRGRSALDCGLPKRRGCVIIGIEIGADRRAHGAAADPRPENDSEEDVPMFGFNYYTPTKVVFGKARSPAWRSWSGNSAAKRS